MGGGNYFIYLFFFYFAAARQIDEALRHVVACVAPVAAPDMGYGSPAKEPPGKAKSRIDYCYSDVAPLGHAPLSQPGELISCASGSGINNA